MAEANRVLREAAQAFAQRQLEIGQAAAAELAEGVRSVAGAAGPANRAAKQVELLRQVYETAMANSQELSDLLHKSSAEAAQKMNQRFIEAMTELRDLFNRL
jgi:phasin family protein